MVGAVIGIDLGTSFFKIVVTSPEGEVLGISRVPVIVDRNPMSAAERDMSGVPVELPAAAFISLIRDGIHAALSKSGLQAGELQAISYSSQANTFLLLDHLSKALTPLISWSDERAEPDAACGTLWEHPLFFETNGTGVRSRLFAIAKIRWFQRCRPDIWKKTRYNDYFRLPHISADR